MCRYSCPSDKIVSAEELQELKKEPTNITEEIAYIETLPIKEIRKLMLHYDDRGYYVLWPNKTFFKKRLFEGKVRYIGPRGHRAPLWIKKGNYSSAIIVEGEINAMSLAESNVTSMSIISPGSATELPKTLPAALTFTNIVIIVDKDIPGVGWGTNLKNELIKHQKKVQLVAVEKDINQIFQEKGKEGVQEWFKKTVDVPKRL